jgi:hypothetical protein
VTLPVAGLSIVETASLTDEPFITMSLRTITASVAGARESGRLRRAAGRVRAQRKYDQDHRG